MTVAVVGGGITGLAAAHRLTTAGVDVVVLEADTRLGGKIHTGRVGDHLAEFGPDMFLGRVPWGLDLVNELGLSDRLTSPATATAFLRRGDELRQLPAEQVLGAPTEILPLLRSRAVSPLGYLRAGLDVILPPSRFDDDASIGEIIRARFGNEVCDRLVDPLVGGINAGDIDRLSAAASAPQIAEGAKGRSLLLGLRSQRRRALAAGDTRPPFWSLRSGLEELVRALAAALYAAGGVVHLDTTVTEIAPRPGGGSRVETTGPVGSIDVDAVVLAAPARVASRLLAPIVPAAAEPLAAIRYSSVGVQIAAFDRADLRHLPEGSGVLSPPIDGRHTTAISLASNKWPHWVGGYAAADAHVDDDTVILRTSVGRVDRTGWRDLDDDDLGSAILDELDELLGLERAPRVAEIVRWVDGFPQYDVGHRGRIEQMKAAVAESGVNIEVVGASVDGLGIPACIRQGREAARDLLLALGPADG